MIERNNLFTIPFYKKSPFTGSYEGMRYRISKETILDSDESEHIVLRAYVFPGPFNFSITSKDIMITNDFDFSEEGICNVCDWLNNTYLLHTDQWKTSIL